MLIRNGNVFFNNEVRRTDLLIADGTIKKIGRLETSEREMEDEIIDARGQLLLPGLIDVHVHLREPGDTYKEDFATGSRAALAGGITTVMDMPNNRVPTITVTRLREKEELARKKSLCDIFFHFGSTNNNFDQIRAAKPRSIKIYMSETTGNMAVDENAFVKHCNEFDSKKPIVVHAEGEKLVKRLASLTKRKLHLAHTTAKNEVEIVKSHGWSAEVAPHHLFLSKKHAEKLGKRALVKPPLRDEAERKALWGMLDTIDCIATDHAPHTLEDKEEGAYGFPGLETSLALMLDAYNKKNISLEWLVTRMAINPAKLFDLNDRGGISIEKKADLIFVDPRHAWTIKGEELQTKCKWTPFDRWQVKGKVMRVIRDGKLVFEEGEFVGENLKKWGERNGEKNIRRVGGSDREE